jgi:Kdo2-lipid IVA lauroyltransferase/acyltransferase
MIFSAILYYLVLLPISILPFSVLHVISRIVYVILYYLTGYRKKVVMANIRNSFPELSEKECIVIAKKFYKHLCDVLLESQKIFTISDRQLTRHIHCINPEIANKYFEMGSHVIIAVGHYNSWELMLTSFNLLFKHQPVVIYQPLKNKFFDIKLIRARSKKGTRMLPIKEVKPFFNSSDTKLSAIFFAIDQSPPNPEKAYWMEFMHQDTAVSFGTEYYAKAYNLPVLYAQMNKINRGYYQLKFIEVTENPGATSYGEITENVTHLLEKDIIAHPEYWLWSHRRWKHKR